MDENTKGMLEAYTTPVDFIYKDSIKTIIDAINIINLQ